MLGFKSQSPKVSNCTILFIKKFLRCRNHIDTYQSSSCQGLDTGRMRELAVATKDKTKYPNILHPDCVGGIMSSYT